MKRKPFLFIPHPSSLPLRRLCDLACFDAGGADLHPHRAALGALDADRLQVWVEAPRGAVIRVRDVVAELRPLVADFASFSHECSTSRKCHARYSFRAAAQTRICGAKETKFIADGFTTRQAGVAAGRLQSSFSNVKEQSHSA